MGLDHSPASSLRAPGSDLGFRVSGKVLERLVDTGQTVKRGQPLMRLDPIDLGLQARAQQEAVSAARARAIQTAGDEARNRKLVAAGAISASAYDQFKAAADTAGGATQCRCGASGRSAQRLGLRGFAGGR